jgi:PAS domain S-box-containing protein
VYSTTRTSAGILRDGSGHAHYFSLHQDQFIQIKTSSAPFFLEGDNKKSTDSILNNGTEHLFLNQIERSDERFKTLLNEAPFSTALLTGKDFVIELANIISLKLWNKDESVIGKPLLEAMPEIITQSVYHDLKKVYDTGITYEGKEIVAYLQNEGVQKKIYVNLTYKALRDEEGNISAVLAVGVDVTDHVESRKKLYEAEERARMAIESAGLGTFDYDYTLNKIITSPRMDAIFGFTEPQPYQKYLDVIYTKDQDVRKVAHNRANETGWLDYEVRLQRQDNSMVWVRFKGRIIFDVHQKPVRLLGTVLETTERRLARKKLEESELRFRTLITETPEVASGLYVGAEHRIQYVNDVMLRFWGKDNSVIGKTFREALPELEGQVFFNQLDKVYTTGESYSGKEVEARLMIDGVLKPAFFNYTYKALRNEDGKIYGIHHMAVDVTSHVLSKQKYIESEKKFRQLLTQAPFGICILKGSNFFVDFANDIFLKLVGRTSTEYVGKPLWEGVPEVKDQIFDSLLKGVMQTGIPFHGKEYKLKIFRNGRLETIFIDFNYEVIKTETGETDGILALAIDVTDKVLGRSEIEKSRDRLNSILESLPQIAWTTNANGILNYVTNQWHEYTGLTSNEALGRGWMNVLLPEESEDWLRAWRKCIQEEVPFQMECRIRRHDGKYRWHLMRALPIYNEGNKGMWVGTSTDIHDQKLFSEELEQKIKERTNELERSNRELEQFAYVSSHDLQEPLRKIITYTGMLRDSIGEIPEKTKLYLERISASSVRMSSLITDILEFSSLAKVKKVFSAVNLNMIMKNVINDFDLLIEEKKAIVKVDDLGVIEAVPLQINQLFYNLMSNSLKFESLGRQINIQVRVRHPVPHEVGAFKNLNSTLPFIQIEWCDNGIGFPEKYAEQIFIIFQRLHDRQAYSGSGIGLAICKRIVANHNGEIYVKSKENEGTTFYILLPIRQEN